MIPLNEKPIPPISEDQWLHHFESLHSEKQNSEEQENIMNDLKFMERIKCHDSSLNEPITEKDISDTLKKLKNKKASHSDKIKNEMIKSSSRALFKIWHIS